VSAFDIRSQDQLIEQAVADAEDACSLAYSLGETPDWYKGSIAEAVDNMSQRELDHLKGRECDPDEQCSRCDAIRALYTDHPANSQES
jgi:hypothetical protein